MGKIWMLEWLCCTLHCRIATMATGRSVHSQETLLQQLELKDVFPYFASRSKTIDFPEVITVLRSCGLMVSVTSEEKIVKEIRERVDVAGQKAVTFDVLKSWIDENRKNHQEPAGDAYNALGTLCVMGIIGEGDTVKVNQMRHVVTQAGHTLDPEMFDSVVRGKDGIKANTVTVQELVDFLRD